MDVLTFENEDVPFTFQYPKEFSRDAGKGAFPEKTFFLKNADLGGIVIRIANDSEVSNDVILDALRKDILKYSEDVVHPVKCGGRTIVYYEQTHMTMEEPKAGPCRSVGYSFAHGGKTWHLEFYTLDPPNERVMAAKDLFCTSLIFH